MKNIAGGAVSAIVLILALLFSGFPLQRAIETARFPKPNGKALYRNNYTVCGLPGTPCEELKDLTGKEFIHTYDNWCGPEYIPSQAAIEQYGGLAEAYAADLEDAIAHDPCLCGQVALTIDKRWGTTLLHKQYGRNLADGQICEEAHKNFLTDEAYWTEVVEKIEEFIYGSEITMQDLTNYRSAMYQIHNGNGSGIPAATYARSEGCGGKAIVVSKDGKSQMFRINCGYQAIDIETVIPDTPPVNDNPTNTTAVVTTSVVTTNNHHAKNPNDTYTDGYAGGGVIKDYIGEAPSTQIPVGEFPVDFTQPPVTTTTTTAISSPATTIRDDKVYDIIVDSPDKKGWEPLEEATTPKESEIANDAPYDGAIVAPE